MRMHAFIKLPLTLLVFIICFSPFVQANNVILKQSKSTLQPNEESYELKGVIYDDLNTPMPGATIVLKGKPGGVITDIDGIYSILVNANDIIVVSFVGMENVEVPVNGKRQLNVSMKPQVDELEGVTVVAFGKQKKESVIASVSTLRPSELKVPASNLTTALAGRMAGIISYQTSGEPGKDNADFFVRGVTTFGYKTSPLILIDGIELTSTDLARLQPDDIASFSIMKDAAATALYGARGANGVILVTTKEGKEGPAKFNVRYEQSVSAPTKMVELADPITYMKLHNEAYKTRNPYGGLPYSLEKIQMTQMENRNKMVYPAVDWYNAMFKDYTMNSRLNANVSGGGKNARYYLAGTYTTDNGILKVDKRNNFNNNVKVNRISLSSTVNINITSTTKAAVRFNGNFDDYSGPLDGGNELFKKVMRTNPVLYPIYYTPDAAHQNSNHILFGNAGSTGNYLNPYADMVKGYKDESRSMIIASIELNQDLKFITPGLNARLMGNTTRESFFNVSRNYNPFYYGLGSYDQELDVYTLNALNPTSGTEYLEYHEGDKTITTTFYMEAAANYSRTFNEKHAVNGMLVGIIREQKLANAGELQLSLPYRNLGLSGRFTYAYDSRYFAEFNFGLNGSERFSEKERFGFFPSMGLGWVISNESFWAPYQHIVSNLKLKGTLGLVGNDAIGSAKDRFFYISNVNMNNNNNGVGFGDEFNYWIPGISIDRYSNNKITWEIARMTNVGVELGLFNKLNIQADVFHEYRRNILMDRSQVPGSMGLQAPLRANIGEVSSKGFEVSLDYSHYFTPDFWLSGRGNLTYATSQFEVYEDLDYVAAGMPWKSKIGNSLSQPYGYIAERLFVDEADIANSPIQTFGDYAGGDIKYKDINNDGLIDENDIVPIGHPTTPGIIYGFGVSSGYKGFDLSLFFQGSARSSFFIDPRATSPFQGQNALLEAWANSHWSEDNRNIYAEWPRLSDKIVENNVQNSTWWLRNGAFLRLKALEFGYTFDKKNKFMDKIGLTSARFYFSGTNLFTISDFKLWDIEMGGNGLAYPIQRVMNLGVTLNF